MGLHANSAVVNANYDKVLYYIDKMLAESDRYCRCARCRRDALAMALNTLPPHYFVDAGLKEPDKLGSPWILIEVAAREALERIRTFPHHNHGDAKDKDDMPETTPLSRDTGTDG